MKKPCYEDAMVSCSLAEQVHDDVPHSQADEERSHGKKLCYEDVML